MADVHCLCVILDLILFLGIEAVVLLPYYLYGMNYMEFIIPVKNNGFRCGDVDILHPQFPPFIPTLLDFKLIFFVKYGLLLIPLIGEILYYCCYTKHRGIDPPECRPCHCYCHLIVVNMYQMIGYYVIGLNLTQIVVIFVKTMVGRLRPSFWDICHPDPKYYVCSQGWIYDDVCTGNPEQIIDGRMSFPSEDTATAFYCVTFLVMYIEARVVWRGSGLLKPFFEIVFILLAIFVGLVEIYDNYSFPSDVIIGGLLGLGIAYFVVYYMSTLFGSSRKRRRMKEEDIEMQTYVVANKSAQSWVEQKL
ncbi:phospholipid phosphatase 2-like [Glandiceps talaboti]